MSLECSVKHVPFGCPVTCLCHLMFFYFTLCDLINLCLIRSDLVSLVILGLYTLILHLGFFHDFWIWLLKSLVIVLSWEFESLSRLPKQ